MEIPLAPLLALLIGIFTFYPRSPKYPIPQPDLNDPIPLSTREHWMRRTTAILQERGTPCPSQPFTAVVVNHTGTRPELGELGEEVCFGVNSVVQTGNMMLHGETAAILNCSDVLTNPKGKYKIAPADLPATLSQLSLYTNAEPCPMCAAAIRWSSFKECIFGTSLSSLLRLQWNPMTMSAQHLFDKTALLSSETKLVGNVASNWTDVLFAWQQDADADCPEGCARGGEGSCLKTEVKEKKKWLY